jgi:hypothetical protein
MSLLHATRRGMDEPGGNFGVVRYHDLSDGRHLRKLRVTIEADVRMMPTENVYRVDLWTDAGWVEVVRVYGYDDPGFQPMPRMSLQQKEAFVENVEDQLLGRALTVLS